MSGLNNIGTSFLKSYYSYILMAFCILLNGCIKNNTVPNIQGNWKGMYNNQDILFIFEKDKNCEFRFYDIHLDELIILKGEFEIDYSKRPMPLSIRHIKQVEHSLHAIIKFVDTDSMIISEFSKRSKLRPITFSEEKQLILTRTN